MKPMRLFVMLLLLASVAGAPSWAQGNTPVGEIKGTALVHTPASAREVVDAAALVLPAAATGDRVFAGLLRDAPREIRGPLPLVVFMHGSSGLGLAAIGEWQQWLAGMGIASLAPNSFALPDRLTYKSPIDKGTYERVHALRLSEVVLATQAAAALPWVDKTRLVLAGTSEGATAVARYAGAEYAARILFSWSCEDNYFVQAHGTVLPQDRPVLNVMSSTDVFFSGSNPWLGNEAPQGHCGPALKANRQASVVLIPGAPHTLLNLPQARHPVAGFLRDVFKL